MQIALPTLICFAGFLCPLFSNPNLHPADPSADRPFVLKIFIAGTGSWDDPNNWDPVGVPSVSDIDSIPDGSSVFMTDGPVTVFELRAGAGSTFTSSGGQIDLTGTAYLWGATFNTMFNINNTATVNAAGANTFNFAVTNAGTWCQFTGTQTFNSTFYNNGSYIFKDNSNLTKFISGSGTFINGDSPGLVKSVETNNTVSAQIEIGVNFVNDGNIVLEAGGLKYLIFNGTAFSSTGNIDVFAQNPIDFQCPTILHSSSSLVGHGSFATYPGNGLFSFSGGEATIHNDWNINDNTTVIFSNTQIGGSGSLTFSNMFSVGGFYDCTIDLGVSVENATPVFTLEIGSTSSPGATTLNGNFVNNGTSSIADDLTVNASEFTNNNQMDFYAANFLGTGCIFTNNGTLFFHEPCFIGGTDFVNGINSIFKADDNELIDFDNTFSSSNMMNAGKLVPGTGESGPSQIGTLKLGGIIDFTSESFTNIQFDAANHDLIDVLGTTTLDGTLHVTTIGDNDVPPGTYPIIVSDDGTLRPGAPRSSSAGRLPSLNGAFGSIILPPGWTWTQTSSTFFINIVAPPDITCPPNTTINTDPGFCTATFDPMADASSQPGCNNLSVTDNAPSPFPLGVTTVTFTATDDCGTATCAMTVRVVDNEPPVLDCPNNVTIDTDPGLCTGMVILDDPTATDNCPGSFIFSNDAPPNSEYSVGTTITTFTTNDVAGNVGTCTATVTVVDDVPPNVTCPSNIVQNAAAGQCQATVSIPNATGTDNCGAVTFTRNPSSNIFQVGTTTVTFTGTDVNGNTATCTMIVQIIDNQLPTVTCPANIVQNAAAGQCQATVSIPNATGTDNCGAVTFTRNPSSNIFQVGTTTVTFTGTDVNGNTATCTMTVQIIDNQPAVLTCPPPVSTGTDPGECSAFVNLPDPNFADNCPGGVTFTDNAPLGNIFPLGTTTVTFVGTDANGNTSTCATIVSVTDNEPPAITCPTNASVDNEPGACAAIIFPLPAATATDNCPGTINITNNGPVTGIFPVGLTSVTYTATDANGVTATCIWTVAVTDAEPPGILVCADNEEISADPGACTGHLPLPNPTANDNCPGPLTFSNDGPPGFDFPVGVNVITFTVTDVAGNSATCSATITVLDGEAPTLTCPPDIEVPTDPGVCDANVSVPNPVVTDNCPGALDLQNDSPGNFLEGSTTVNFTATDVAGNQGFCSVVVTVLDEEAPTLDCPSDLTIDAGPNCAGPTNLPTVTASDNCTPPPIAVSGPSGTNFPIGTSTVVFSAQDDAGNIGTCLINLTVQDLTPPVLVCPANISVNAGANCQAQVSFTNVSATDNCTSSVPITGPTSGNFDVGSTTVVFTATDAAGNAASCSVLVTVSDNVPPVLTCPTNISANTDPGVCTANVNFNVSANDNCPVTISGPTSGAFSVGTTMVNFSASDASGNSAACSVVVTVSDNQPPVLTCPPDATLSTDAGLCTANVNFNVTATDNCTPSPTVTGNNAADLPLGTTVVVFTATDANGLVTTCNVSVEVVDNQAPTLLCPPDLNLPTDPGLCTATVNFTLPTASDNCPGTLAVNGPTNGTFPAGATSVAIFSTSDAAGNTAQCQVSVTVTDNEFPTINCPPDITTDPDPGQCFATLSFAPVSATDNCEGTVAATGPSSGQYAIGQHVEIFTANFPSGATLSCNLNITVNAGNTLTINCPDDISVNTDPGACTATVPFQNAAAAAACGLTGITNDWPAGNIFQPGATTVTFTATDNAGGQATCQTTVTVSGNANINMVCPPDLTVDAAPGACTATVPFANASATADCGPTNLTNDWPANDTFGPGETVVTFTATDALGNSATCTTTILVNGNANLNIVCPPDVNVNPAPGACTAVVPFQNANATADCGLASLTNDWPSDDTFPLGTSLVTFTATDNSGNSAACLVSVTVNGAASLSIDCPDDVSVSLASGACVATVPFVNATAQASCGLASIDNTWPANNEFPAGTTAVVFTATDNIGGQTQCQMTVTVDGANSLNIACPPNISVPAGTDCSATIAFAPPDVTVACGPPILTNNWPANNIFATGTTVVTYTLNDQVGGQAQCQITVSVLENVPPSVTCPPNQTLPATTGNCQAIAVWPAPNAADNCGVANLMASVAPGTLLAAGTSTTVTYTATDNVGNSASCSFTVSVTNSASSTNLNLSICPGQSVSVGGQIFSQAGNFTVNLLNSAGCDSTINVAISLSANVLVQRDTAICTGESILLGGALQTTAGIYQDILGGAGGACDTLIETNLIIKPKPALNIMGPLTICPGALAVLSAGLFTQYAWSPGGETSSQITVSQPGTYAVTVTATNGCTASDAVNLIEYCGAVEADFALSKDTVCANALVQFTDQSLGGVTSWLWDFGNGNFSTQQNPQTFYASAGLFTVRLIASDGLGADTMDRQILIYPNIEANFTYAALDLCHPTEIAFAGSTPTNTFPINLWQWNFGDGQSGTGQNITHQYGGYDTVNVTLIVRDVFGCADSLNRDVKISPNAIAPLPVDLSLVLCPGESVTVGGTVYNETNLSGTEILSSQLGCDSVVNVSLSYIPGGNIDLGSDTTICENQSLTLNAGSATNWLWSNGATTQTITVSQPGDYSVTISNNGNCAASGKIRVGVDLIPNQQAEAGPDQGICSTQPFVKLDGTAPAIGTGQWTTSGGAIIDNPANPKSFLSNLATGANVFTWTLNNGACRNYASDQATVNVTQASSEVAFAGNDVAFCAPGAVVQLDADAPATPGVTGAWSQAAPQNLSIADPNNPQTTLSGLSQDNVYLLKWTLTNGFCGAFSDDEVLVSLSPDVLEDANAGDNRSLCQENSISVEGNLPAGSTGRWTLPAGKVFPEIGTPEAPETNLSNIEPGKSVVIWTLSTPLCPNYSADTLILFQSDGLQANDDEFIFRGFPLNDLNLLANDAFGFRENIRLDIISDPAAGNWAFNSAGNLDFAFGNDAPENVEFRYRICMRNNCPDICDEATIRVVTTPDVPAIKPPRNVLTANGDGTGDRFAIPNFDEIPPTISLTVVNRWGDVVFEIRDYRNDWQGTDSDGKPLPDGTYFYILEGGGGDGIEKGYVTILR